MSQIRPILLLKSVSFNFSLLREKKLSKTQIKLYFATSP